MTKAIRLFVVAVIVLSVASVTQAASNTLSPKEVIKRYLQLDSEAAGLSPETWSELGQYTTFPSPPTWESFVVIQAYDVGKAIEGHTRAQIQVTYYPIGQMSDTFKVDHKVEHVSFSLNNVKGQWKVDAPMLTPHVSFDVIKRRLQQQSASNPASKKANDDLLKQMEAALQTGK